MESSDFNLACNNLIEEKKKKRGQKQGTIRIFLQDMELGGDSRMNTDPPRR